MPAFNPAPHRMRHPNLHPPVQCPMVQSLRESVDFLLRAEMISPEEARMMLAWLRNPTSHNPALDSLLWAAWMLQLRPINLELH